MIHDGQCLAHEILKSSYLLVPEQKTLNYVVVSFCFYNHGSWLVAGPTCLCNKFLLSVYSVLSTFLNDGGKAVNKTDKIPSCIELYSMD